MSVCAVRPGLVPLLVEVSQRKAEFLSGILESAPMPVLACATPGDAIDTWRASWIGTRV